MAFSATLAVKCKGHATPWALAKDVQLPGAAVAACPPWAGKALGSSAFVGSF